jgi:hypothetical protein
VQKQQYATHIHTSSTGFYFINGDRVKREDPTPYWDCSGAMGQLANRHCRTLKKRPSNCTPT